MAQATEPRQPQSCFFPVAECRPSRTMCKQADPLSQRRSHRTVLAIALALALGHACSRCWAADDIPVTSPDGNVQFILLGRDPSRLSYQLLFRKQPVIETSPLGIHVDEVDLGQNAEVGKAEPYRMDDQEHLQCLG